MKKLFPLGNKGDSGQITALPGSSGATGDSSTVKDFIGKVYNVNKYSVTVEDVVAEGELSIITPNLFNGNYSKVDSPSYSWSKHMDHQQDMR